jgi:hypothetical protein
MPGFGAGDWTIVFACVGLCTSDRRVSKSIRTEVHPAAERPEAHTRLPHIPWAGSPQAMRSIEGRGVALLLLLTPCDPNHSLHRIDPISSNLIHSHAYANDRRGAAMPNRSSATAPAAAAGVVLPPAASGRRRRLASLALLVMVLAGALCALRTVAAEPARRRPASSSSSSGSRGGGGGGKGRSVVFRSDQ